MTFHDLVHGLARLSCFVARIALVGAGVVTGIGAVAVVRPDLWLVERVRFEGNERSTDAELRHLVDIRNGTTIWTVDLGRAVAGAERHPWVEHAEARREWPDTVVVHVDEYAPVALLAAGTGDREGLYYVDAEGVPFMRARSDDLDYPLITGLDPELGDAHPDVPGLVVRHALGLLDGLESRRLVDRSRVSEVHFSARRGFTVVVSGGARIVFDLDREAEQLDRLARLAEKGVDLRSPLFVDLAPETLAIVRPLDRG